MSKSFQGVWGTFAYMDETVTVIETLRSQGKDYSVLSPCPRHELFQAMGEPTSRLPWITLIFGGLGIFFGYGFPAWTAMDWVLPVSGKPIVGIPAFTIIGFELMVLLGGLATAGGLLLMGHLDLLRKRMPRSEQFKSYNRFSNDRFGIVVRCLESEVEAVETLMREHSVEEVVREF